MMSRRGLLGMVAVIGALAGCSTVSSGASKLQKSYAAETGVASVSVISRWQQETIFHDIWSADVSFVDGLAADRKAQLIARFFELASRAGLPSDRFDYVIFRWAPGTDLTTSILLDAGQSAELLGTIGQAAGGGGSVDAGRPPDFGVLWVRDAQDGVAFLDAAQPLLSVPRAASFFTSIAVESKMLLPSQGFRLMSDRALTEGDLRLLSFLRSWLPAHRVLSFRIPLSRDVDGVLRVTTPDDQTAAVRQLAAVVRTAGIPATINGYKLGDTDPYVSIP
jgi:hypothetical protein